jgi:hypothetical protein
LPQAGADRRATKRQRFDDDDNCFKAVIHSFLDGSKLLA